MAMRTLNKRIEALEAGTGKLNPLAKIAYQTGIITPDEYHFFLEHDGMTIPPIAWVNEDQNDDIVKYRIIGQKIGILPRFSWQ